MEMWKKKKIEKNKEKCRKYYEKKREEGTNAKNRKCHCGYSETPAAEKKRKQRQDKAEKRLKKPKEKESIETKLKQTLKQPPLMILKTVFPIGCRKAGPYNQ